MQYSNAQVVITLTATPGTCPGNGSITANVTGVVGTPLYSIKSSNTSTYSVEQASNVFPNLGSGTFTVKVHDASGSTISDPVTLTNAAYTFISVTNTIASNAIVTGCDPDGSIDITIAGGRPPFNYSLSAGPTAKPAVVTSLRTARFSQLETGIYTITISDDCANIIVRAGISVISQYNMSGITFGSVDGLNGPTQFGGACKDSIAFSTNNLLLKDENGNVIFQRDVKHMPAAYPMEGRVEYPAGSGIYTPWQSIFGKFELLNYQPASNQYAVQVRNPCNPSNIVTTPAYTIPYPYQSRSGLCAPSITRTTNRYECGPINIHIVNKTNNTITRDYVWDGSGASYTLDLSGLALGDYAVNITTAGASYPTSDVSTTAQAGINLAATYNYVSTLGCDFYTGGIRSFRTNFPTDNIIPLTYTIVSGPVTDRPPVTALQPINPIWNDLPGGAYQIRVDYGDCRTETKPVTLTMPFAGFAADELSYVAGSSCGKFKITGKGWYLAPDSTISTSTTQDYAVRLFNAAGNPVTGVGTNAVAINNAPFTLNFEVDPGTYRVKMINQLNSALVCYYLERTITIPPYSPVVIDVTKSGGVACGSGFGDVHVEAVGGTIHLEPGGGSRRTLVYRLKPQGTPDTDFTPYQLSPDFPGRPIGTYTAQIYDSCGYTTTQDITLVAQATSSSINLSGATSFTIDSAAACQFSAVSLRVSVIGTATNITWTLPDGSTFAGDQYLINSFAAVDSGEYFVRYGAGGCSRTDSVHMIFREAPSFAVNDTTVICAGQSITVDTVVHNISANSTVQYYINPQATILLPNTTVSPTNTTRYFLQATDNATGCKSPIVQTVLRVNHPPLIGTVVPPPTICAGETLELTIPTLTAVGTPITDSGWMLNSVLFDPLIPLAATQSGIEVNYFAESACGTTISPTITVTVNPTPSFSFTDPDTVYSPRTVDLTALTLSGGDTTGVTLTYYDSAYNLLTTAEAAAVGDGLYHIVGVNAQGCADTATVDVAVGEATLPVGLFYFTAEKLDDGSLLKWATAWEQNSVRFEIEQSSDGINFSKIATVAAAGNSNSQIEYRYTDPNIMRYGRQTIYYRLRQVDLDGRFKFSSIRLVSLNDRPGKIRVYPIPFTSILSIDLPSGFSGPADISISDMNGRTIFKRSEKVQPSQTNIVVSGLESLASGTYILTLKNDRSVSSFRVMKQ